MLVPFRESPNFLLVSEHSVQVIEHILTGSLSRRLIRLPYREESPKPGGPRRVPLFTNWARPMRFPKGEEYFYFGREDGIVYYLNIVDGRMGDTTKAGDLKCRIGTAFSILDMHLRQPDVLICAGELCNGGLFSVSVNQARFQTIR